MAPRAERPRTLTILLWALRAWLAALAGYSLAVTPVYTSTFLLFTAAVLGLAVSAGLALVPTRRPHTLQSAEALALLAFIGHVMGHAFGFYARIPGYDKVLHFLMPALIVIALYQLSQSTRWIWAWTKVRPFEVAIYLFAIMGTIGALWEIFEFSTDVLLGTSEQDGNFDTMTDLIADLAGALTGATVVGALTAYGRKHGFNTVSEARSHLTRRLGERAFARRLARRRPGGSP